MLSKHGTLLLALFVSISNPATAQDVAGHAKQAVELGWTYFNKGDADTALKRFNQARIIDPRFAPGYFGTAYVYSVQGQLEQAIQYYWKSIELDPSFSPAYSNLGLALIYSGKTAEAFPILKKALDLDPGNGDAHANFAVYYFNAGDYAAAWQHVHAAQDKQAVVSPELIADLKRKLPEPTRQRADTAKP